MTARTAPRPAPPDLTELKGGRLPAAADTTETKD